MLATLDFNLAQDADGNDLTFKARFSHGISEYVQIITIMDRFFGPCFETISGTCILSLVSSTLARTSARNSLIMFSQNDVL